MPSIHQLGIACICSDLAARSTGRLATVTAASDMPVHLPGLAACLEYTISATELRENRWGVVVLRCKTLHGLLGELRRGMALDSFWRCMEGAAWPWASNVITLQSQRLFGVSNTAVAAAAATSCVMGANLVTYDDSREASAFHRRTSSQPHIRRFVRLCLGVPTACTVEMILFVAYV
jgi:hypothetical protein